MAGSGDDGPELRQVLVTLAAGASVELWLFDDVAAFCGGKRPAHRLRIRGRVRVFEGE